MRQQGKTNLNYVAMSPFNNTILLRRVGASQTMLDSFCDKEFMERTKLTAPINLDSYYFPIKHSFNHILKSTKNGKDIRFI